LGNLFDWNLLILSPQLFCPESFCHQVPPSVSSSTRSGGKGKKIRGKKMGGAGVGGWPVKFGRTDDQREIDRIEEHATVFESPVATWYPGTRSTSGGRAR
jgi:hypothetical protein